MRIANYPEVVDLRDPPLLREAQRRIAADPELTPCPYRPWTPGASLRNLQAMAARDTRESADGTLRVTLEAFQTNLLFYKSIGAEVQVRRHKRTGGFLGLFPATRWVSERAERIEIRNTYFGQAAGLASKSTALTRCTESNASDLDCKLWAVGIGVTISASATSGLPDPQTASPTAGPTVLDIRAVRSAATVMVAGERFDPSAEIGTFSQFDHRGALTAEDRRPGHRISCVTTGGERIQKVGGTEEGTSWSLSVAEVVEAIRKGEEFYVERPEGDQVKVIVATSARGHKYIKTQADGDTPNNLLALPRCGQQRG